MKKIIFLFSLFCSLSAFAVIIVSDLDDTIKITNAGSAGEATWNAVFTRKVFAGIPEFLEEGRSYVNALHILSATPTILRTAVVGALKKHGIKFESITLKNPIRGESKVTYKTKIIRAIMSKTDDDFIFIGDDVNEDHEVFDIIIKEQPSRVLAAYVHMVKKREHIPATVTPYWTSVDLALREYAAGRMSASSVDRLLERVGSEQKLATIIPDFAHCPTDSGVWKWQLDTIFAESAGRIIQKLNTYCKGLVGGKLAIQ